MASALIGAGASLLSGITGGKGAQKAAQTQANAYQQGIGEQQREFNTTQANFAPFLQAGQSALGATGDLLGLHGNGAQGSAITSLQNSPLFTSQYQQGADTILQNAAATGGLRGGNTQNSLAQFGSGLLGQVIQQQLGNLGGLVNVGSGSAGTLGSLGQANSSGIASLLGQQGAAQAGGTLGGATAQNGTINSLAGFLQSALGSGGNNGGSSGFTYSGAGNSALSSLNGLPGLSGPLRF